EITYRNGTRQTRKSETVKRRVFRAKSQLRNLLTRDGERRVEK
ncbi:RNA polymerase sigma factor, partial [Parabacteroides merdae]|nr:RNA polymerase sigma factor [Parabacteroides merdae]